MNYFVYVPDLVGVETNLKQFHWPMGHDAPTVSADAYHAAKIKVHLEVVKDREVFAKGRQGPFDGSFRYFLGNRNGMNLCYDRRLFRCIRLAYTISVRENEIRAIVGRSYFRAIRYKVMNVHPIGYILFDLVTAVLLKNGYTPLYGASVSAGDRGALLMAPPNAGKTLTAMQLSTKQGFSLLSEDLTVSDGDGIWPVPWTNSYRSYGRELDRQFKSAGRSHARCALKNVFFLRRGGQDACTAEEQAYKTMLLLNRYGIGYYASPALHALSYLNDDFSMEDLFEKERTLLGRLCECTEVRSVTSEDPVRFAGLIEKKLTADIFVSHDDDIHF